MDPLNSAQDVVLCTNCTSSAALLHCDICHLDLCEDCVIQHISDISKDHKVVPITQKGSTPDYPICLKHSTRRCQLHCVQCDIPICVQCSSSKEHKGHTFVDIKRAFESKKDILERDLQELEKYIRPKYLETVSSILVQKTDMIKHFQKIATALIEHGEAIQNEINNTIKLLKSDLDEMGFKHLAILNEKEDNISQTMSEITQNIADIKKLLESNDICLVTTYKSRIAEFRKLPPHIKVKFPIFSPQKIDRDQISQCFGTLSSLSFTTEDQVFSSETPETESSQLGRPLMNEPFIITTIKCKYNSLFHVACQEDDKVWTSGQDNMIKLYNLQGELLKSIQTKSGSRPGDVSVTNGGDLVYTDDKDKSVNIVNNTKIQEVIRLRGWIPRNVCCTTSGDLLVIMDNKQNTKVVRYSYSKESQSIQFNDKGQPLYSSGGYIKYISENKTLDICVSDVQARAVVVVSKAGKIRFRYTGPPSTTYGSFCPIGIATDSHGRILTADYTNDLIHILDQDGQFLRYIDNCHLQGPWGLCVDTNDNLFVAEHKTGEVKKIQYYMLAEKS
ncbi:E3 ubiquitin-protein ligase TRIM71 [Magallana gigas]|uniref:E3 ubiquitin-protein ligase TRIM71 n=1 Tax=Magallana gigas TaxID=29159 RepID=UPI00333FD29C